MVPEDAAQDPIPAATTARRRGRPPTGSLHSLDDIGRAIADRLLVDLPVTAEDIAADLATSRRVIARIVKDRTGSTWAGFISPFLPTSHRDGVDDGPMRRITLTLADETIDALRRRALSTYRDPRLEARLILESALTTPRRAENPPTPERR